MTTDLTRDDLTNLLSYLDGDTLAVKPDGLLVDQDGYEYQPDAVANLIRDAEQSIAKLKAVVEWAKKAPQYKAE
jgi:hypothetical protein